MDEIYHHLGSNNLWESEKFQWSRFEGFRIWKKSSPSMDCRRTEHVVLHEENSEAWLATPSASVDAQGTAWRCVLQMVIVGRDAKEKHQHSSGQQLLRTLAHFNLQLAYDYVMSCPAGLSRLPCQMKTQQCDHTYTVANHPKLAMLWKHKVRMPSTVTAVDQTGTLLQVTTPDTLGVVFVGAKEFGYMRDLMQYQWSSNLVTHAMFPAFIAGLHLASRVDRIQQHIKGEIRKIEVRTGHHCFNSHQRRGESSAPGDLQQLSASLSGFAIKLAGTARKMRFMREVHRFIEAHTQGLNTCDKSGSTTSATGVTPVTLRHHVGVMESRLDMQLLENEFTLARVNVQMTAVRFNCILLGYLFCNLFVPKFAPKS